MSLVVQLRGVNENAQAHYKLLKKQEGCKELDMSWWRTRADISHLCSKAGECVEDEIVKKEWFYFGNRGDCC